MHTQPMVGCAPVAAAGGRFDDGVPVVTRRDVWRLEREHAARVAARVETLRAFSPGPANVKSLSEREAQILYLVAAGHSRRQIADALRLSANSIDTYRQRLTRKVGVRDRHDLRALAVATYPEAAAGSPATAGEGGTSHGN